MATDATFTSGDNKTIQVTITDSAGAAVNLAGAAITYVIADRRTGSALITKTLASGITVGGASNNVVSIALEPDDTADLAGTYRHELEITDGSGNVNTALQGYLTLVKDYSL